MRIAADQRRKLRPEAAIVAESAVSDLDPGLDHLTGPASRFLAGFAEDLIDAGRYGEAVKLLRARAVTDRDAVLLGWLGTAYRMDGQEVDAERCWRAGLAVDPTSARLWLEMGKLELRRGRPGEAIESLGVAARLDPEAHEPAYQLAVAYRRLGEKTEADRQQRRAEKLRAAGGALPKFGMNAMPEDGPPVSATSSGSGGR